MGALSGTFHRIPASPFRLTVKRNYICYKRIQTYTMKTDQQFFLYTLGLCAINAIFACIKSLNMSACVNDHNYANLRSYRFKFACGAAVETIFQLSFLLYNVLWMNVSIHLLFRCVINKMASSWLLFWQLTFPADGILPFLVYFWSYPH